MSDAPTVALPAGSVPLLPHQPCLFSELRAPPDAQLLHVLLPPAAISLPALGGRRGTAFLGGARVRLELDEFFGHLVIAALRQDAQHREARVVHVDAAAKGQPAGGAPALDQLAQLQHGQPHRAVLAREAVVLDAHLQLVALRACVSAQRAAGGYGLRQVICFICVAIPFPVL